MIKYSTMLANSSLKSACCKNFFGRLYCYSIYNLIYYQESDLREQDNANSESGFLKFGGYVRQS